MRKPKISILLGSVYRGVLDSIKAEYAFNRTLDKIGLHYTPICPTPKIFKLYMSIPFNYSQTKEIYNLAQEYSMDADILVAYAIQAGMDVDTLRCAIENR